MTAAQKATLIGLVAPLLWATFPVLLLGIGNVPPFQIMAYAFSFSFLFSLTLWLIQGKNPFKILKQPLHFWLVGIGGIFTFNFAYTIALKSAPPAESFLLTSSWPILCLLFTYIILKEKLYHNHIIACILGFSGICVIAFQQGFTAPKIEYLNGYIIAFMAACTWAIYSVLSRKIGIIPVTLTGGVCGATAILASLLHLFLETHIVFAPKQYILTMLVGLGPIGIAYYCWNHGIKEGDIRTLSSFSFIAHFLAMTMLISFGYSQLSWTLALAFTFIISGSFIGSLKTAKVRASL